MSSYFKVFNTISKALKGNKSKVSPDIKSVKPNFKKTVNQSKSNEYIKRIDLKNKAETKVKTGKKMMKEGLNERKNLVDTGKAFKFKNSSSIHAMQPGDKLKYKDTMLQSEGPQKKFKKGKELKANGGRIGRRFGGDTMPRKKTNVQKIKETFGPKKNLSSKQMKIAKLAGNPNKIDGADFKKLRNK